MLERFLALAAAAPDAVALIEGHSGSIHSRKQLLARIDEVTEQFVRAGLVENDVVALQLPNSVDFLAAFGAVLKLRLTVLLLDRDTTAASAAGIMQVFAARALVDASAGSLTITRQASANVVHFPRDTRVIKMTSGSTGAPKGIAMSEAALLADCLNICTTMGIRPDDINFGAIPMSHSYGFSNLVTPLFVQGTAIVVANDYLPQSILNLCNGHRCTVLPGIPMVFDHLVSAASGDFETVRTFISAGAPLSASTSRRFRERFGSFIHTFFGCSECGGITYDREGGAVERGTVGRAMDGVELTRQSSRLVVQGPNVASGYILEDGAMQPFESQRYIADDLIEFREDGEVVLIGRSSDLINTASRKINPREVEAVLLQLEGVREAKVYGEPAGARGEVVAAAIVADPGVTREDIRAFCRQHLPAHKVPRILKLIDAIPLDDRGKVSRAALAAL